MHIERILVVGSGGREHALAWRLARDPGRPRVYAAPGNDGMSAAATGVPAGERDVPALLAACREHAIDLVVIGPETPIAEGVGDALRAAGFAVFAPGAAAARLESSKWFAKELMREAGIPTARAEAVEDPAALEAALGRFAAPWVIKADGLAAGKGVLVTAERASAERFGRACLAGERFGASGRRLVIEEFLAGEEASIMAVCDGESALLLPAARDFKRARDGDAGGNTGGMGAFAPSPAVSPEVEREVERRIVLPLLRAMAARGTPYRGLLYVGLMLGPPGPRVVEFNVRFGDPESEVVLPLVAGSLARLLASAAAGRLDRDAVTRRPGAAVAVALVDEGYPDAVRGGGVIEGLDTLERREGVRVFHAGTARDGARWRVRGGRAAYVVAEGADVPEARARTYAAIGGLTGNGWRCRSDIAAEPARVSHEENG